MFRAQNNFILCYISSDTNTIMSNILSELTKNEQTDRSFAPAYSLLCYMKKTFYPFCFINFLAEMTGLAQTHLVGNIYYYSIRIVGDS